MSDPGTIALVGLGVAGAGTAYSVYSGERARDESKAARRAQEHIRARQTQRERLQQIRQQQIAQAQVVQGASTEGTQESSGARGGFASIGTQSAANIGFINQIQDLQQQVQARQEAAGRSQLNAQLGGQAAQLGGFVYQNPSLFSSDTNTSSGG